MLIIDTDTMNQLAKWLVKAIYGARKLLSDKETHQTKCSTWTATAVDNNVVDDGLVCLRNECKVK